MKLSLKEIKEQLKQMLLEMSVVKTDKGVLEYEGDELAVGTALTIVNDEDPDVKELANGEYVLEDGRTLIVESGELKEIVEAPEVEPVEVVEEPTEETEPEVVEEPTEEVEPEVVEEPTEEVEPEVVEEPTEEETPAEEEAEPEVVEEPTEEDTRIAELEAKIAELEALIAELTGNFKTLFSTVEKMSLAKPVTEEFENIKTTKKTGNSKLDKFLTKYGN